MDPNLRKAIERLDGFAAVNLAEPSPGDLERVFKAYSATHDEVLRLRAEVEYLNRQLADERSGECDHPAVKSARWNADRIKIWSNEESIREIIHQWKWFWMNQTQNSEEDRENYYRRAVGVDSNMIHNLAKRICRPDITEVESRK